MRLFYNYITKIPAVGIFSLLCACSFADNFGDRAIDYNLQAEQAKDQNLLLNIIRSAYRKPMQFTDLSTVTGTATGTAQIGASLPFFGSGSPRLYSFSPQLTETAGPSFTVAVLDTKEFYQGILTPIQKQVIAYYVAQGFPKGLLLRLLISKIVVEPKNPEDGTTENPVIFVNDQWNYGAFDSALDTLLTQGLDVETVEKTVGMGPLLGAQHAEDLRALAALATKASKDTPDIKLVRYTLDDPDNPNSAASQEEIDEFKNTHPKQKFYYQFQRDDVSYRFCFRKQVSDNGATQNDSSISLGSKPFNVPESSRCGYKKQKAGHTLPTEPSKDLTVEFPELPDFHTDIEKIFQGLLSNQPLSNQPSIAPNQQIPAKNTKARISLTVRSVEGVIYYLGEIARCRLDLVKGDADACAKFNPSFTLQGTNASNAIFCISDQDHTCPAPVDKAGAIATDYAGRTYNVSVSPSGSDRSVQTLEIVTQLLALNNSAKDLPAPSVIPIIAQ